MQLPILQPEVVAALIALLGVFVSVIASALTSRKQLAVEIEKLNAELHGKYEEKLVDLRLTAYSSLWESLAKLNKDVLQTKLDQGEIKEQLADVLSMLEQWYEINGIVLSKNAYGRFTRLCSVLDSYASRSRPDNPAELAEIRKRVWDLRQMLREDIHLTPIVPGGSMDLKHAQAARKRGGSLRE